MPKTDSSREIYGIGQDLISMALRDDPLMRQYGELLCNDSQELAKLRGKAHVSGSKRLVEETARISKQICTKYCIPGWTSKGYPTHATFEEWLCSIKALNRSAPFTWGTNWGPFFSTEASLTYIPRSGSRWKQSDKDGSKAPTKPTSGPPTLTIRVDLSEINGRNLDHLASDFKLVLKRCLQKVPADLKKPSSPWSQNNERDYRRFKLHMDKGVPFRWIAAMELGEKLGKPITLENRKPLNIWVKGEERVRDSVCRVYTMLFRKPYAAKRRNIKPSDKAVHAWNCPDHSHDDCLESCQYARAWIAKYRPFLKPGGGSYSLYTERHTRRSQRRLGHPLFLEEDPEPEDYLSFEQKKTPHRKTSGRPLS